MGAPMKSIYIVVKTEKTCRKKNSVKMHLFDWTTVSESLFCISWVLSVAYLIEPHKSMYSA